jgi:hypothetical protein
MGIQVGGGQHGFSTIYKAWAKNAVAPPFASKKARGARPGKIT